MIYTPKQNEYIREAQGHRWGIKSGAVRSGKTFLDVADTIPRNIRERMGKPGLVVILGNTKGTLQRNVIAPMQDLYGSRLVSDIRSDNTAQIFGETCFCLGADNIRHVNRIRGSSIKYCYCDEAATYNQGVFEMLKSRLDKEYSRCDATCNPDAPAHWFKKFLDSDADIYRQAYTLDDNPTLPAGFVEALNRAFADHPEEHLIDAPPPICDAVVGVDFGGHGSAHAFSLVGFTYRYKELVVLDEWYHKGEITPQQLDAAFVMFLARNANKYPISEVRADSAETTLINGIREAAAAHAYEIGQSIPVYKSAKKPINSRINCEIRLFSARRFKIMRHCIHHIEAFANAVWDEKSITEDIRLDNGTVPSFDVLDACEYGFEMEINTLVDTDVWSGKK